MIYINNYDHINKIIELIDNSFDPSIRLTFPLFEAYHWSHVSRKSLTTKRGLLLSKIRRHGGVTWLHRELIKYQNGEGNYGKRRESSEELNFKQCCFSTEKS